MKYFVSFSNYRNIPRSYHATIVPSNRHGRRMLQD